MNINVDSKDERLRNQIISLYEKMLYLRLFEEKVVELYPEQEMQTPVHLGIGQEAISVAFLSELYPDDIVYSNHRGHLHYLAKGGDPYGLVAELYGKSDGCSKGRGGSMHLVDVSCGLMGSSAIVSGGVPIAVGAALGIKMQKKDLVSIVFLGDGACDEGVVYEAISFAALKKLPVIFVVENNGYATSSSQKSRQPLDNIYERGKVFDTPGYRVDGNDVLAVKDIADKCIAQARSGQGPSIVECITYRIKGHVGIDEDTGYRSEEEILEWKQKCPLTMLQNKYGIYSNDVSVSEIKSSIDDVFQKAKNAAYPEVPTLLNYVFEEKVE